MKTITLVAALLLVPHSVLAQEGQVEDIDPATKAARDALQKAAKAKKKKEAAQKAAAKAKPKKAKAKKRKPMCRPHLDSAICPAGMRKRKVSRASPPQVAIFKRTGMRPLDRTEVSHPWIEHHGYFRVRGDMFYNFDLDTYAGDGLGSSHQPR